MGVTLDGFVHGAKGYEDWGLPPEDDEVVAWKAASLREAGTHIMAGDIDRLKGEPGGVRTFPGGTAIHVYRPAQQSR
jgi:hypothetical protein